MSGRILGLVGGIGPESTLDYYRRLIDGYHARAGADRHPPILIDSIDGGPLIGPMVAGDLEPMRSAIEAAVAQLAAGGAGLAMIGSVASHSVFALVAPGAPVPMLSIVAATCRAAVAAGIRRPAIFGTRVSVEESYFARPFEAVGIEIVRPSEGDRAWIHDTYLGELVRGLFRDQTRARLLEILTTMRRRDGIDGLILGGTELSLILPEPSYDGVPVLNAAAIHVSEALDWLLGGDPPGPGG